MKYLVALVATIVLAVSMAAVAAERMEALPSQDANVRVLAFKSETCGQCQQDKAELRRLIDKGVNVQIVDVDRNPAMARRYGVRRVPEYVIERDGVVVERTGKVELLGALLIGFLIWLIF